MLWILISIYILIVIIEVPGLLKKQLYRELIAFTVIFVVALYMGLAFFFQWPLNTPFDALMTYVER